MSPPPAGVHLGLLSDRAVERVLSEACFVAPTRPTAEPHPSAAEPAQALQDIDDAALMATLSDRYQPSTASDWTFAVADSRGVGPAAAVTVPGWVRERAAEVLFGDGPEEAPSVSELVLDTLLKLPVDLRPELAAAVLVTGGTASLPGLIPRLRDDVRIHLRDEAVDAERDGDVAMTDHRAELAAYRRRTKYAPLNGLGRRFAVLNDPAPLDSTTAADASTNTASGGSAPRWAPALMPWVGGSLAGILKTGAPEIAREDYDTRMAESQTRGQGYVAVLTEERGEAPAPAAGLALDDLAPGMAVGVLAADRKRGWAVSGAVPDWTTASVRAGGL